MTVEAVNEAFRDAASNALAGILEYSDEPLVSSDIVGVPASCVFDSALTMAQGTWSRSMAGTTTSGDTPIGWQSWRSWSVAPTPRGRPGRTRRGPGERRLSGMGRSRPGRKTPRRAVPSGPSTGACRRAVETRPADAARPWPRGPGARSAFWSPITYAYARDRGPEWWPKRVWPRAGWSDRGPGVGVATEPGQMAPWPLPGAVSCGPCPVPSSGSIAASAGMPRRRSKSRSTGLSARSAPLVDASEAGRIRRQSCETKARYGEHLAEVVAEEQSKISGETIEAYRCRFAPPGDPHWHIGHPISTAASQRQAAAARRSAR